MGDPLLQKVDCIMLHVPDVDAALRFYRDELGHELVWRHGDKAAAVRLGESELVLNAERKEAEVDIEVGSAAQAAERFVRAGGRIISGPFDIRIGMCVVVSDSWGNLLVLLYTSKGMLRTDEQGNVVG